MTNQIQQTIKADNKSKGVIVNRVPELLAERGESVMDLMYGARIASGTAYAWISADDPITRFDDKILVKLCNYFGVGVGDILKFVPE